MELTEQEEAVLDTACDDWIGLCELRQEFAIVNHDGRGREIRGPTELTLRSLLSKGLIQLAYISHHPQPVRMPGPYRPPDVREIPNTALDEVFADSASWQGSEIEEEAVEFTALPKGVETMQSIWRQRQS